MIPTAASKTHDGASQESHCAEERHDGHFMTPLLIIFQHDLDGNSHKENKRHKMSPEID